MGLPEKLPDRLELVVADVARPSRDEDFMATALLLRPPSG